MLIHNITNRITKKLISNFPNNYNLTSFLIPFLCNSFSIHHSLALFFVIIAVQQWREALRLRHRLRHPPHRALASWLRAVPPPPPPECVAVVSVEPPPTVRPVSPAAQVPVATCLGFTPTMPLVWRSLRPSCSSWASASSASSRLSTSSASSIAIDTLAEFDWFSGFLFRSSGSWSLWIRSYSEAYDPLLNR